MKRGTVVALLVCALATGVYFASDIIKALGLSCDVGTTRPCDCPEAQPRGFQMCSAEGRWTACVCMGQMMKDLQKQILQE